jgi:hypothetical protein
VYSLGLGLQNQQRHVHTAGDRKCEILPPGPMSYYFPNEAAISARSGRPFAATRPKGESALLTAAADGIQTWTASGDKWVPASTQADLVEVSDEVCRHLASQEGLRWTARDGSSVTAKVTAESPAGALHSLPWQRLIVSEHAGNGRGLFSQVTSIQRIATLGGEPPPGVKPTTAKTAQSRFTAYYIFYGPVKRAR